MDLSLLIREGVQPLRGDVSERPAISLEGEATWTYGELNEWVNRTANFLVESGIEPGDRVGLCLVNSLEYVGLYFGIVRAGAIAVRLNWRLAGDELTYAINDAGCSLLCVHGSLSADIDSIRSELSVSRYLIVPDEDPTVAAPPWAIGYEELIGSSPEAPARALPTIGDRAMIMYTSGTTGRPKGAVWTHGNSLAFASMQQMLWSFDETEVAMIPGPLFHVGGLENILLPTLLVKGHVVLMRSGNFTIERTMRILERTKVTIVSLQVTMIYELLRSPLLAETDLSALRRLTTGGTNLYEWALEQFIERLPHVQLSAAYGLTEGGAISTHHVLSPGDSENNVVGVPVPLTEVKVWQSDRTEAPEGTNGEVLVRSASSPREYWNNPEASAETFIDGWCRTGDLGNIADGVLTITGRLKDMIRSGGENIYAVEVENVLICHPSVADVAVVGVPDPKFLEVVCAVVVAAEGCEINPSELIEFCRDHMASYKKPRHVVVCDELPRTGNGKVRKQDLRERYAELG